MKLLKVSKGKVGKIEFGFAREFANGLLAGWIDRWMDGWGDFRFCESARGYTKPSRG